MNPWFAFVVPVALKRYTADSNKCGDLPMFQTHACGKVASTSQLTQVFFFFVYCGDGTMSAIAHRRPGHPQSKELPGMAK